jgi:hypothetical protein
VNVAEGGDRPQPPEKISPEQIRAELRAAGLLRHLDTPKTESPPGTKRREATVLPFRKPAPQPAPKRLRTRQIAIILYSLLFVLNIALVLQ